MFTATEAVPVAKVVAGNKRYPGVVALDNVNFTLNKGEVRALLGKNGAGKSTLIRMLTGSERPDSGDIWIGETRLEGDEATLTRRAAEKKMLYTTDAFHVFQPVFTCCNFAACFQNLK